MNILQFINPFYCQCTAWSYYEELCYEYSCNVFWWTFLPGTHTRKWNCWVTGRQMFNCSRLFSKVALPISLPPPLVFEHITEELFHWSIPYGLAEKEELNAFRSDKPQRREEQEQFPEPERERGHHQFYYCFRAEGGALPGKAGGRGGGEDRREVPRGCKEEFQGKAPFTRGVAVAPTPQCVVEECDEMMNKYFLLCVKIVKWVLYTYNICEHIIINYVYDYHDNYVTINAIYIWVGYKFPLGSHPGW